MFTYAYVRMKYIMVPSYMHLYVFENILCVEMMRHEIGLQAIYAYTHSFKCRQNANYTDTIIKGCDGSIQTYTNTYISIVH